MDWLFGPPPDTKKLIDENKKLKDMYRKSIEENDTLKKTMENSFQSNNSLQARINSMQSKLDRINSIIENKTDSDKKKIEDTTCSICLDPVTEIYALVPCGHTNLCSKCYTHQIYECPICRKDIEMRIKVFR